MEQISFFLEKFKILGLEGVLAKRVFIETVERVSSVRLTPEQVTLRNETFFVKATPAIKSELYIHKESVLAEVAKKLGKTAGRKIT